MTFISRGLVASSHLCQANHSALEGRSTSSEVKTRVPTGVGLETQQTLAGMHTSDAPSLSSRSRPRFKVASAELGGLPGGEGSGIQGRRCLRLGVWARAC